MDSRAVIGVPDAYELPSTPGNGYLKSDTQTITRFKAAYVSGPYRSPRRKRNRDVIEEQLVPFTARYIEPRVRRAEEPVEDEQQHESQLSVVDVLIDKLRGVGPAAHQVWLPPLRQSPSLDELLPPLLDDPETGIRAAERGSPDGLQVAVGLIDLPGQQRRELLRLDLSGSAGNIGIAGGPQNGKSTLLRTVITALALTHSAREVQFYCLDFGGGTLAGLLGLPHVGSVAGRLDRDRVSRTVLEVLNLLTRREVFFQNNGLDSMASYRRERRAGKFADDPYGDVFLVVDGWSTLRQEFEDVEELFRDIATRGLTYGVHLIVASQRWSEIRTWMRGVLGTRLELRLGDPIDSEVNSRVAAKVPNLPGRGITAERENFSAALPRIDGRTDTHDLTEAMQDLVEGMALPEAPKAPPVRLLPTEVAVADLPAPKAGPLGVAQVPLGIDDVELAPLWHDFDISPHLIIFGDTETGKTNMLRHVAQSVTRHYTPDKARIMFADLRRELYNAVPKEYHLGYSVSGDNFGQTVTEASQLLTKRLPGPEITPERLPKRDWWHGGELFVIVDDHEIMAGSGNPLQALNSLLPQASDIGLHVIIARSTSGANRAMMDQTIRRLWDLGTPVALLSCPKDEGRFLGDVRPKTLPPGRAQFVNRRRQVRLLQTPHLDPANTPAPTG
ncbi:type VII secretion protein EccCb [Saccharopolyspora gregorii]|uniref:type VII secretion protein EccCb n=1 Tax=Saccharopolyspora gregorii TaxID=33914 RepID=UPI0021ACA66D|nr:type VII secretion protein EccCb [Saccharopolyspora gregorii]